MLAGSASTAWRRRCGATQTSANGIHEQVLGQAFHREFAGAYPIDPRLHRNATASLHSRLDAGSMSVLGDCRPRDPPLTALHKVGLAWEA